MSSDDSDVGHLHKRKRKSRRLNGGSPSSSDGGSPIIGSSSIPRRRMFRKSNRIPVLELSDTDSDSGSSIHGYGKRKKVERVVSDTDSDTSGSTIIKRTKRTGRIPSESEVDSDRGFEGSTSSQWETDFSDNEMQKSKPKSEDASLAIAPEASTDSDSSDGQSEKCPICLRTFRLQEIGTPETCDHMFCLECIQEWSKNINTCPVDRQEYTLVLVRKNILGKVIRQIPIEKPVLQNDLNIIEDPTFCEICGSSENEDRMLLCDGCDLGFHLYCLRPALDDVPVGAWFCQDCSPDDEYDTEIELNEIEMLLNEVDSIERLHGRRRRLTRLIPRTRQSERVRRRIANNRQQNSLFEGPSTSSSLEESQIVADPVSSTTAMSIRVKKSKKPKKRKRKTTTRYKIVYEIDPNTGEAVPVRKRQKKQKSTKRTTRNRRREAAKSKSVKKRLAMQLGICRPRSVPQNLPDVRVDSATTTLGGMRSQAGIPTLHLFGQSHELDYFSDDNDILYGSSQVLLGRATARPDVSALHSVARRKAAIITPSIVSSSTDLLDNILSSQQQFHARNSSYSVDSKGNFKIENRKNYIDVKKQNAGGRQRPNPYQNQGNSNSMYNTGSYHSYNPNQYHSVPSSTVESATGPLGYAGGSGGSGSGPNDELPQDYTQRTLGASYDPNPEEQNDRDDDNSSYTTPSSESDIDIYSDIETVSTSKADHSDEVDIRPPSPPRISNFTPNTGTDEDNNDSEPDMVIDDEKMLEPEKSQEYNGEEAAVSSTVGFSSEYASTAAMSPPPLAINPEPPHPEMEPSFMEIQSGAVQSSNLMDNNKHDYDEDSADGCPNTSIYSKESMDVLKDAADVESDDGCPNFSIYSKESKSVALHTDISLSADDNPSIVPEQNQVGEISSSPNVAASQSPEHSSHPSERELLVEQFCNPSPDEAVVNISEVLFPQGEPIKTLVKGGVLGGLYSDSDDEDVVKKGDDSFAISDINHMTEDISEEERSYTPCLDEKGQKQGLEGLDTELISDEDRNDFDESHELKTVSDGDALEINAKESELDFTRPEDYEEGEIIDKNKTLATKKNDEPEEETQTKPKKDDEDKKTKKKEKEKDKSPDNEKGQNKENEVAKDLFKKLSRSNKERNYRDKDKENSNQPSPEKSTRDEKRDRRREKRKELERYNVRALIADKPRPLIMKDQFGRDIVRSPTKSRSRSYTPPINNSPIAVRKSASPSPSQRQSSPKHRSLSRLRESPSKDRRRKRRPRSRQRSPSRSQSPRKKRPRSKSKKRKSSGSQYRKRRKSRERYKSSKKKTRSRRARTPSASRRNRDWNRSGWSSPPEHRHVSPSWTPPRLMDNAQALGNQNFTVLLDNSNKKKKDKRRKEKRTRESGDRPRKRRRERERTPPPSKEVFASGDNILVSVSFNNENETRDVTTRDRRKKDDDKNKKGKEKRQSRNRRDLTGIKPVAIIDLERSPFKEMTPSPKQVIVLSDSDNNDDNPVSRSIQKNICDSSQQVSSPERNINFSMGPKTPPEPQIKFSLNPKPPQVRAIMNPLHEPDDMEVQDEPPAEIDQRINESLHKGPNTPPEPPNSPPSSPDAYDPFEPTKSRSPTPEPIPKGQSNLTSEAHNGMDSRSAIDLLEKCTNPPREPLISMTPPLADIQPADSQSSIQATPESNLGKSPERIGVLINQTVQTPAIKPVAQTTPFSTVPTSLVTSTPISSNLAPSRINILNSTMITPPASIPQRIVLPNLIKSSPVKIPPTKTAIKSTPIKPMPSKTTKSAVKKNRAQNGNSGEDLNLDFDSPYSPGSSDYEDLFEPPPDNVKLASKSASKTTNKSPQKHQSVFDTLFGSPSFALKNKSKGKFGKKTLTTPIKTKTVGVKLDEDHLKILDELPNSAVEMQVKDKFLKKLNRQERVVEEVKLVLKPYYNKKRITKDEYKDIMRRAVPKICHNKSGEINPTKIKNLIEAYVRKIRHSKKVTSSSSVNTQKA